MRKIITAARAWFLTVLVSIVISTPLAADSKELKLGIVTFLTGASASSSGVPSRNAAQIVVEAINQGTLPAPYNSKGLAGAEIKHIFLDENSKDKVADFTRLVEENEVDIVIGYISSGSCKAISPVAEAKSVLTVFAICGTAEIFESINRQPEYVFRTTSHATMDNVAAARYAVDIDPSLSSIAGVNQDYSWGHGSWRDFATTVSVLKNGVAVKGKHFPKLFAGRYQKELGILSTSQPDMVHSSFWGGDLEALVVQGGINEVFSASRLILPVGDASMHRLGPQIPNGTIIGARGATGQLAPDSVLNDWFKQRYFHRFGAFPTSSPYLMVQAILAVKAAADKVGSTDPDKIRSSLKGLRFTTPSGLVSMELAQGHQAIVDAAYGTYQYDRVTGKGRLVNIKRYPARCVNPPLGVKSFDWIRSGFAGAGC